MKKFEKNNSAGLIWFGLTVGGFIQKKKLDNAAKNCAKTEEETLRSLLEYAKDSVWGKEHHFDEILKAKSAEELYQRWQENVKTAEYETFAPYIERHKNGEENILFPGKPKMYATTSGTTKEPKWIPITERYYSDVYSKMTKVWLYTLVHHRRLSFAGRGFSVVGKAIECYAPDGTPCGSISGISQRDCPEFVKKMYTAPGEIFTIPDYKARNYSLMRLGLDQNVSVVITANPSTMLELQKIVDEYYDDIVSDIENGTLSDKFNISPEIRNVLKDWYKPNPKRAAELKELKKMANGGQVLPKDYWPHLQILNTWHCGNTKVYTEKFRGWFPEHMLHQEFSYYSSECRFGVVIDEGDDTVLFPHMHYYEFVEESEIGSENPHFLQTSQLEVGKRYTLYVTTAAGLYRYNMNDLIKVTGKYGTIPTVQFVQKLNGIISMTGEKLSEQQFMAAVEDAEKATGLKTRFYVGFADLEESMYKFYYDFENSNVTQERCNAFTEEVDKSLKAQNEEYLAKRDSFRVKPPAGSILIENAFDAFKSEMLKRGSRDGQFKMNLLMQDEKRHEIFKTLLKNAR